MVTVKVLRTYERFALDVENGYDLITFLDPLGRKLISFLVMFIVLDIKISSKFRSMF